MKTAIIIPARLGSVRLPRKPLKLISGISLIERVYRECAKAHGISVLIVATDSEEIKSHVESFGGTVIMTPPECENGTMRVATAAENLPAEIDVIINVQGDEPLIDPVVIEKLRECFERGPGVHIATPISPMIEPSDMQNPSAVKVALTRDHRALYFSRAPIPFDRDGNTPLNSGMFWKHIGVYGFRRKTLQQIMTLPMCPLEETEKLEQLRWLDAGYSIHCVSADYDSVAVDTLEDVLRVESILKQRGQA